MGSAVHLFSSFPFCGCSFDFLKNFVLSGTYLTVLFLAVWPTSFTVFTGIYTGDIPHPTTTVYDLLQTGIMTENTLSESQFPLQAVALALRQLHGNLSLGTHRIYCRITHCITLHQHILLFSKNYTELILRTPINIF